MSDLVSQGWCQGAAARTDQGWPTVYSDPEAVEWSLGGARDKALRAALIRVRAEDEQEWIDEHRGVLDTLLCTLAVPTKQTAIPDYLMSVVVNVWNDEEQRTAADVLALLYKAQERLQ